MIGTLLLQQVFDLTDAATLEAVAFNQQWHYALDIVDDSDQAKYVSDKTLRNYRRKLIQDELDSALFNELTDTLLARFGIDATHQRLDSTHLRSNMRTLRRLEIFGTTITAFLKQVRKKAPAVFATFPAALPDRYLTGKAGGCFSRVKPSEASQTLQHAGEDLAWLIDRCATDSEVSQFPTYRLLTRVFADQCRLVTTAPEARVEITPPAEVPADSLQNPSDPDASYDGHKGQGFQAQLMETFQPDRPPDAEAPRGPNFITYVAVEPAHCSDDAALHPAVAATQARGCGPTMLQADGAYGSDQNVQDAAQALVTVIAPTKGLAPRHDLQAFAFDPDTHMVLRCPATHAPEQVKRTRKGNHCAIFARALCQACPRRPDCPIVLGKRGAYLRYDDKQYRLALRRAEEQTPAFRARYRWRAGIEGTNSQLKRVCGAARLRVRGLPAVRFAVTLKALGINIFRATKALAAGFCLRWIEIALGSRRDRAHVSWAIAWFVDCQAIWTHQLSKNMNFRYYNANFE